MAANITLIVLLVLSWVRSEWRADKQEKLIKPIRDELKTNGGLPPEAQDRPHGTTKEEAIIGVIETKKQNEKIDRLYNLLSDAARDREQMTQEIAGFKEEVRREIGAMKQNIEGLAHTSVDVVKTVAEVKQAVDHTDRELVKHKENNEKWKDDLRKEIALLRQTQKSAP